MSLSFAAGVDSAAQGSVLFRNASSRYAALAPSTSGLSLLTQGAGANPVWGTPAVDFSPAVILAPAASARNTIQPTGDAVVGTTWKWHSATHSANTWELRDNANNLLSFLSVNGNFNTGGLTLSYNSGAGSAAVDAGGHLLRLVSSNFITLEGATIMTALTSGAYFLFKDSGFSGTKLFMPSSSDPILTAQAGQTWAGALRLEGINGQANFLLEFNQLSSTLVSRNAGKIDAVWGTNTDASRHGQLVFYSSDNGGDREAIRIGLATGTAAAIGVLGAAPVVRQVGASAAGIAAITDANARAAISAIQNALANFGFVTAPA